MNMDNEKANQLWDQFLQVWPAERLNEMTLEEYSKAGSKDTFTYWIEKRLEELGSIWGGSAFKFGIFNPTSSEKKESGSGRTYDSEYGWYSKYGDTREKAFQKVRGQITNIIEAVRSGNLELIDGIDLGDVYKWKIAFHYQDRNAPVVINTFTKLKKLMFQIFCSICLLTHQHIP